MNKYYTIISLALLLLGICSCTDSEIGEQFTFSMTDRTASFTLYVSNANFTTDYKTSSQSFTIFTTDSWELSTTSSWISFTSTSGTGDGKVNFTIQENPDEKQRTASILVSGVRSGLTATVTVTQSGKSLSIETSTIEFDYSGGVKTVNIQADGHFSVQNNNTWLSCEPNESTIRITAQPNSEINQREAVITISLDGTSLTHKLKITQSGVSGLIIGDFDEEQKW